MTARFLPPFNMQLPPGRQITGRVLRPVIRLEPGGRPARGTPLGRVPDHARHHNRHIVPLDPVQRGGRCLADHAGSPAGL